ncbi:MAG: universal stress protein [Acidimicrobiales bacterium]
MTVQRIVVGAESSPGGVTAMRWVAELAAPLGATVVAVHAFDPLSYLGKVKPPIDFAKLRAGCEVELREQWCAPLRDAGVAFEVRVEEDQPVEALVRVAEEVDADLIVVGARALSTLKGLVLGSTSMKLPHHTSRPVCIVHPR